MERNDINCYVCDRNIWNVLGSSIAKTCYFCPQDENHLKLLKRIYPKIKYKFSGFNIISAHHLPDKLAETIFWWTQYAINHNLTTISSWSGGFGNIWLNIKKQEVTYAVSSNEDAYYKIAGIKKHEGKGGWRRYFRLCSRCATKLEYICPVCESKLVREKITNR